MTAQIIASKQVLIIDDNDIDVLVCSKLFKKHLPEVEVLGINNASEALIYLSEQHQTQAPLPDLIIVDLYMPLMNGWFFLKEYRQVSRNQDKNITLLITSCTSYDRDFQQMREFKEVSGYIAKPFTLEKIASIADRYLGSR